MDIKEKIYKYIINSSNKIKINSKDLKKNDVFIALQGLNRHGNQFLDEAIKVGAKYCITDKKSKIIKNQERILLVDDIFYFLKELSIKKRSIYKGEVVGITGSAGKTSLKETLKFFLEKKFKVSASIKSYNNNLGVIISILNMNLNSHYSIFEIGTNNFCEVKNLTKIVQPSQIFITNILSTHLENFKNKKNIAIEKSDILKKKYNPLVKTLYFQKNTKDEEVIYDIAKKQRLKQIIKIGKKKVNCYVKNIKYIKSIYEINLKILNRSFKIKLNEYYEHRVINLIFVLTFFVVNNINTAIFLKNINKIPIIEGRGSRHKFLLNGLNIKLIDESYNANPETMIQCIKSFSSTEENNYLKILILGNMNELGLKSIDFHFKVIKEIEKYSFDKVILSGDFFKKALRMFSKLKNEYVYKNSSQSIMSYLKNNVHKKAILMTKCSNITEVNKFVKLLKLKYKDRVCLN